MADQKRYVRVGPSIWLEPWDDDTRYVALYVLTGPHRRTEGLFRLPLEYAMVDLHWPAERFRPAFQKLCECGFVEYDAAAGVCLIVKALEWQAPENPNQVKAAIKKLEELPPTELFARFAQLAQRHCERLAEALAERFPERLGEGFAERFPEPAARPSGERLGEGIPKPQAPTPSQTPEQPEAAAAAASAPSLPRTSYRGKRVDADTVSTAVRLLEVFNDATKRSLGAATADGRASKSLVQIVGALVERPDATADQWEQGIRRMVASPPSWVDGQLKIGHVFGASAADWTLDPTRGQATNGNGATGAEADRLAAKFGGLKR